jgi:ribose transport system permease protein
MTATETPQTKPSDGGPSEPSPAAAPSVTPDRSLASRLGLDRFSALYLLAGFFVFFTLTEQNFLQWNGSIELVLTEKVIVCMLALAFLVPLTTETFDLSIGANMALSLVIVNKFAQQTDLPDGFGALLAIAACVAIGAINGFVVVRLGVNSFIATLGMSQVIAALIRRIHDGGQIVGELSDSYVGFGKSDVFSFNWPGSGSEISLPWYFVYGVLITIGVWYVLEHTPLGRHMFATGGNREAARLSGVKTDSLTWGSLMASAALAGFAGLVYSWKFATFTSSVGPPLLFPAVAAVFFGASQLRGRPNVWGTIIAVYTLAFGIKGIGLRYPREIDWMQPLFEGLTLIIAVGIASRQGIIKVKKRNAEPDRPAGDSEATGPHRGETSAVPT